MATEYKEKGKLADPLLLCINTDRQIDRADGTVLFPIGAQPLQRLSGLGYRQ